MSVRMSNGRGIRPSVRRKKGMQRETGRATIRDICGGNDAKFRVSRNSPRAGNAKE
jgi:hypothetical protein